MAESAKGKAAVKLSDTRLRRRRVERIADAKAAKAEEGSLLAQAAAEAEATKSAKAARELKPNVARLARHDFEDARWYGRLKRGAGPRRGAILAVEAHGVEGDGFLGGGSGGPTGRPRARGLRRGLAHVLGEQLRTSGLTLMAAASYR